MTDMNKKKVILAFIGTIFLLLGLYFRVYDPAKSNISYEYIGIGTWAAGLIYYSIFQKYKEITSFLLGLVILHTGVILLLIEKLSNPRLLGVLVFIAGIVIVLSSGLSDYLRMSRAKK